MPELCIATLLSPVAIGKVVRVRTMGAVVASARRSPIVWPMPNIGRLTMRAIKHGMPCGPNVWPNGVATKELPMAVLSFCPNMPIVGVGKNFIVDHCARPYVRIVNPENRYNPTFSDSPASRGHNDCRGQRSPAPEIEATPIIGTTGIFGNPKISI